MMRLRAVPVLIASCLLFFAMSAYAGCAWVLWVVVRLVHDEDQAVEPCQVPEPALADAFGKALDRVDERVHAGLFATGSFRNRSRPCCTVTSAPAVSWASRVVRMSRRSRATSGPLRPWTRSLIADGAV